jgi:hypothetical protein
MPVHGGRSMGNVRVGALERGGPCRGGGVEPSSEAVPARGGVELSSEADFARGGVKASSEADLARGNVEASSEADSARGSVYPSSDANPARGGIRRATLAGRGGHQGRERVACML